MFEQPPCPDGHGEDCPERACVECGAAILVGLPPAALTTGPFSDASVADALDPDSPDRADTDRADTVRAVA